MASTRNRRSLLLAAALFPVTALCVAGCGDGGTSPPAATPSQTPSPGEPSSPAADESPAASPTPAPSPTPSPSPTETGPPKFAAKISTVSRSQVKYSWRPGCPVPLSGLRLITMTYWGFDHKAHTGELMVNKSVAADVASVFRKLYGQRYPIRQMRPVDVYKGDDYDSIDADNTSAFNCRNATGSSHWSQHAYGFAVDLNPRENPYVEADGGHAHKNADAYVKRPLHKPGVINAGDKVVKAFESIGWGWGGYWSGTKDYQHFSQSGR